VGPFLCGGRRIYAKQNRGVLHPLGALVYYYYYYYYH